MLPSEIPWVLYEGSGDRGPFPLVVDGTPITYADVAHIRVTRFDEDGVATVLVEGTDYQLSATAALPDLNDVSRPVTAASFTLKVVQPVLDEGEYVLAERIAPADQSLSYTQAGGFSSSVSERNLDAIVRVIQQMYVSISRGIFSNRLDGIPTAPLELPTVADRADKFFYFDADGNPALASPSVGLGDLISSNNLSDLASAPTARTNLGLGSAALLASSAVFQVANNLSEGSASAMRSNLGVYSIAQLDAAFAAIYTTAHSWLANQFFSGSNADVATFYRSGAAAKTRWIESTNNNYHGIRNNADTLTFDYNGTDYLTFSSSGAATFSYDATTKFNRASTPYLLELQIGGVARGYIGADATKDFIVYDTGGAEDFSINNSTGAATFGGNIRWGNTSQGTLTYAGSNAYIDSSGAIYLRPASGNLLVVTEAALVDRGSAGASLLYVGGANNQGTNIVVRANAGYSRGIIFDTGASSARWYMEATSTAESGGNAGSDFVLSSWTDAGGYLSAPLSITRSTGIATFGAAIIAGGPVRLASYTVAGLPAGSTGDTAYASNGRKNGEGAGAGTGVLVFKDGTAWRACDTGATVAA